MTFCKIFQYLSFKLHCVSFYFSYWPLLGQRKIRENCGILRTEDCTLETIGKPVFKRYTPDQHGGWMMDPSPRDPEDYHKVCTCGVLVKIGESFTSCCKKETVPFSKYVDNNEFNEHTVKRYI
jgi:hypothetical protein